MDELPAIGNEPIKTKRSLRFKIGIFLLIINTPFGYGAGALAAYIFAHAGRLELGAAVGLGIYIFSWLMLGLGVWLAGPEGVQLVKELRKKWFGVKTKPTPPVK